MAVAMQCKSLVSETRKKRVSDVIAWLQRFSTLRLHEARNRSQAAGTVMHWAYQQHGLDDGASGRAATFWARAEVMSLTLPLGPL